MAGILDFLTGQGAAPWSLLYPDRLPVADANQLNPLDKAAWPVGPNGAPIPSPYPQGGDPMTAGGPTSNGPGLPAPAPQSATSVPPSWGALYASPLQGEADQAQQARDAAAAVLARRFRGASHAPAPAPDTFGQGATPFGFAGPGSMTGINPANFAAPVGPEPGPASAAPAAGPSPFTAGASPVPFAGGPVTSQPPAGSATDISSANRAPAQAPAAPAMPPAAPSPAPFSFGGAGEGVGDRLMKATRGFLGNLGNGPIGALAGGVGALVTGQNTDPTSIAAEQSNATAKALLAKGASPAEVQAARYNPALMKALIENHYGKDKWSIVQVGENDGVKTYKQQNQVDGTLRDIPGVAAGGSVSNTVTGPDGKPIAIPADLTGAARKEFVKRVAEASADAATGKQTEAQGKSAKFSTIATQAEGVIKQLEAQGQSVWGPLTDKLPLGGAYAQSPEYQKYKAAKEAFLGAHLRDVSGAAIGSNEYVRAEKTFFPQPGEGPEAVAQKAALRKQLIQEMGRSAGPGYKAPSAMPRGSVNIGGQSVPWSVD